MHIASQLGRTDIVELLLRYNADIDQPDFIGMTALMLAVQYNHIDTVKCLLQHGANVNRINHNGSTCLFFVKDLEMARLLLDAGCDPHITTKYKQIATYFILGKGHHHIAELIESYTSDWIKEPVDA